MSRYEYEPSFEFFKNNYHDILGQKYSASKTKTSHWIAALCHYIKWEDGEMPNWVRGIHYHIISKLPVEYRKVPGNQWRDYRPGKDEHVLWKLKEARYEGWIPFDWIIDKKNDDVEKGVRFRQEAELKSIDKATLHTEVRFSKIMPSNWKRMKMRVKNKPDVERAKYNNQDKRLVVISEKRQVEDWIKSICNEHGADLLCLGGQPSVTRTYDLAEIAREDEERPIHAFYLADCDYEGYCTMENAFKKQLNTIYPNSEHELERILLNPDQIKRLDLPFSYNPEKEKESTKSNITKIEDYQEASGLQNAYELDALTKSQVQDMVRETLEKHSNIDKDRQETKEVKEQRDNAHERIDLDQFKSEYEKKRDKYKEKADEIEKRWEEVKPEGLLSDLKEIKTEIVEIREEMEREMRKKYEDEGLSLKISRY